MTKYMRINITEQDVTVVAIITVFCWFDLAVWNVEFETTVENWVVLVVVLEVV